MLLDPRNGPNFDTSVVGARHTYILATTPRTGSTLLARSLWASGAGAPKEYCNPTQLRDWTVRTGGWRSTMASALRGRARGLALLLHPPLEPLLHHIRSRRSQGGWFGLKLHAHHARFLFGPAGPEPVLGPVTWIRLSRPDRVAQAISWELAVQTDRWSSSRSRRRSPRWARPAIARRLAQIHADTHYWDTLLSGRPVLQLDSDALFADPLGTVDRVRRQLQLPAAGRLPAAPSPMSDPTAQRWREHWERLRGQGGPW